MTQINSSLLGLLFKIAGEKYRELVIISLAWRSTIGDLLSERYKILKFEKKTLYIEAINHLWMQDFVLYRPMYLEKLRKETKIEIDNILVVLKT